VSNGAPERRQPALQFILERLDPVLHLLGAVPHLAEVAVHATYHGFASVTLLFRDGEQADRRALVESLQPSRAVGVPEHLGPDLPSLPPARAATASSSFLKADSIVSSPVRYEGKSSRLGGRTASKT